MRHPKVAAPLMAGALMLGGVAACSDSSNDVEDVSPELDEGSGEDGLVEEDSEG